MRDKILIIDDERKLTDTLALILEHAGYEPHVAYNGTQGMAVLARVEPQLVILDVIMPGMDGVALATQIAGSHPDCHILLFSGNAETAALIDAARHTGRDFELLAKPVPPAQLLQKIASLLHHEVPELTH